MAVAVVASAVALMGPVTPARASTRLGRAVEVSLPPDADPAVIGILIGVGCPRVGSCAAGGSYTNVSGHSLPFVVTESGGRWVHPVALALPSNAELNPIAQVSSVACPAAGSCVADGYYYDNETFVQSQGFVATQSHGQWGAGQELTPPVNAAVPSRFALQAIACAGVGSCVAVGTYKDTSGLLQAMAASESHGT